VAGRPGTLVGRPGKKKSCELRSQLTVTEIQGFSAQAVHAVDRGPRAVDRARAVRSGFLCELLGSLPNSCGIDSKRLLALFELL
jgi:hypothetical protein